MQMLISLKLTLKNLRAMMSKLKGQDKLERQLNSLKGLNYSNALHKGGEVLKSKSMINAPVDKGDLRRSHKLVTISRDQIELIVRVLYSSIVEFNQPYLRPAIDYNQRLIGRKIGAGVQDIINKKV